MTGGLAAWALVLAILVWRRHRHRHRNKDAATTPVRRLGPGRWRRVSSFTLVTGILAACVFGPALLAAPGASANALGFSCKEQPAPETPGQTSTDFFDSDAAAARGDGTDYGKYGWAGLVWHTYDLGCGPDVVRAPGAVWDNTLGSAGLAIAKGITGFAIWMDRQAAINPDGSSPADTVLGHLDQVVAAGSAAMKQVFYDPWLAVGVTVVGLMVLYFALKANSASAMRQSVVAGIAVFMAAMVVGMPMATMHEVNRQFNSTIGQVQGDALRKVHVDPQKGPREAVIGQIIIRQWRAGYFGDPDSLLATTVAPELRDALAFSYTDKANLAKAVAYCAQHPYGLLGCLFSGPILAIYGKKNHEFDDVVHKMHPGSPAYGQFIGKAENRASAGWIAAFEAASVDGLWIAASLLRFIGMLILQLAVLFAPVWAIPAMVSEKILGNVVRFVGAALFWAVVAAAAVAVDLVAMTGIFKTNLPNGWKVFVMVLIAAVIWMLLRPFKRLTQFVGMNAKSATQRARSLGRRVNRLGSSVLAGFEGAGAGYAAGRIAGRRSDESARTATAGPVHVPQEGLRALPPVPLQVSLVNEPTSTHQFLPTRPLLPATVGRPLALSATGSPDNLPARPAGPVTWALASDAAGAGPTDITATEGSGRVVAVDAQGRVVDIHEPVYQPVPPQVAEQRLTEDGDVVYDLYTSPGTRAGGLSRTGSSEARA